MIPINWCDLCQDAIFDKDKIHHKGCITYCQGCFIREGNDPNTRRIITCDMCEREDELTKYNCLLLCPYHYQFMQISNSPL